MDALNVVVVIALIYCALFFFDTIFKSCSHVPYLYFLKNTGLELRIFQIRWFTTAFNRTIIKWGMDRSRFWSAWFNAGVIITLILLPIASFVVAKTVITIWSSQSLEDVSESGLLIEPMIPGIDMPLSQIGFYAITLAICSIVHEFGHAMAAIREDVQLYGLGLIVVFTVPMAYAQVNSEQLFPMPTLAQLRVVCAGIWHNVVLATLAAACLILTAWLWAPLYAVGSGVYVKTILPNSPVLGTNGLLVGDTVFKINDCLVKDSDDWYRCILDSTRNPTPGYCVSQQTIRDHDESVNTRHSSKDQPNCCGWSEDAKIDSRKLCFEFIEGPQTAPLFLPPHACLPARIVIEQSENFCWSNRWCSTPDSHCMRPSVENGTKIIQIKRKQGKDIIYSGHPANIYRSVDVSDWVPKYSFLDPELPESMALLCKYITIFSTGLAVVNVVPCFFFDGQHITTAISRHLFQAKGPAISLAVTSIGTLLLAVNLLYVFTNKLF